MIRAYQIPVGIDPSSLPITFEGERAITAHGDGYVEVDGFIDGYPEIALRRTGSYLTISETKDQTIERLTRSVQSHLDAKAQEKNYDGIISACSYAAVPNQFQTESQAYLIWRANVWATCYELLDSMTVVPTNEELIALLPVLVLP